MQFPYIKFIIAVNGSECAEHGFLHVRVLLFIKKIL